MIAQICSPSTLRPVNFAGEESMLARPVRACQGSTNAGAISRVAGLGVSAYNRGWFCPRSVGLLETRPIMYLIYSLLFSLGVVLTAPYYVWRLRNKIGSFALWQERFGILPSSFQQAEAGAFWVHAVSVGETLAAAGLVQGLQRQVPQRKIFLSHLTLAGREAGENRLPAVAGRFYLPLDWHWCVRGALDRIRPALLLIVETELWPNLLRAAHQYGARVILVNARLSDRSFRGYRLFRPFMRRVLENVDWVCAQTPTDAERFRLLGAKPERVVVTGNMKFDGQPPQLGELTSRLERALRGPDRSPVVVAASTMPGEEPLLLRAWGKIRRRHPRALMILAPRHPARFETVARYLAGDARSFVRRTALEASDQGIARQLALPEILLLDTIGELAGIFELADVVFVGGSLVPTGGHNPLEPAFWSKPILFGPYMENFRDTAKLFREATAAVEVRDPADLAERVLELLENPARRRQLGEAARKVLEQESGATQRILERLSEWLDVSRPSRAGV